MPKRRPDSTALQIVRSHQQPPSPESLIAVARRQAPSATSVTAFAIEPAPLYNNDGRVVGMRRSWRGDSITAAAELLNGTEQKNGRAVPRRRKRQAERWQNEVWELRNESPEMRFLGDRKARSASQCRIYIGHHRAGDVGQPDRVVEGVVGDLAQQLFGNLPDVEQKLKRYVQHLEYNGESIINVRNDDDGKLVWSVHSSSELLGSQDGQYQLTDGVSSRKVDSVNEILARSYTPSPEKFALADAPVRALLPVLRELVQMTKYVAAQIDSKLATGGGVLFVAQDVQVYDSEGKQVRLADELHRYMLTAIEDRESAESIAPLVAEVPTVEGRGVADVAHLMTFSEALDPHMHERRSEAIRRIALGMDSDPAALEGAGSMNHWCVDEQTEVYTQARGWVRHADLAVGDEILTLNHDTGMSEWKPVQNIYRADVTDEPMRLMKTQRHNSLTTAAHRWPVLVPVMAAGKQVGHRAEWTTSDRLNGRHTIITGAQHADLPTTAKWSDDLVELVAWYWTEGSMNPGGSVRIAQSHTVNPRRVDRIRGCLTRTFGPAGDLWREAIQSNDNSHGGPVTVFHLRKSIAGVITEHANGVRKIVPTEFVDSLTLAQLDLFIDVSCQGDGWHYRRGVLDIWQENRAALAAFERALLLSGRAVSTHESSGGVAVRALKSTRQRPGKGRAGDRPHVVEQYTGVVWCPTTANGTWFARRNGQSFFTGNSAWSLDEAEIKLGVAPIMSTFCHTMTEDVVRPLLAAQGVENVNEFSVWFDTSELKLRPDRSKDAQWAYDKGLLSGVKTLAESGFDAEDMPDATERSQRLISDNLIPLLSQLAAQPGALVEVLRSAGVDIPATTVPDTEAAPPAVAPPSTPAVADDPPNSPPDTLDNQPPTEGPTP